MFLKDTLDKFDLPEISFWYRKCDKIVQVAAATTDAIIAEFKKTHKMVMEHPEDKNLRQLMRHVRTQLEEAYEKEKGMLVTNPLQSAIDLMVLDATDLERWMECYAAMDPRKLVQFYLILMSSFVFHRDYVVIVRHGF